MSVREITPSVALVGSPNSGKTTLFNWLTGAKFKPVNYAGSTVDTHEGLSLPVYGPSSLRVIDTPGIYSLNPHGRDEEVTFATLTRDDSVAVALVVVDGTQLNRQLYLVRQIQALQLPFVVAITMMDLVRDCGRTLNLEKLAELINAPVVPIDGKLGGGVQDLVETARPLLAAARPRQVSVELDWDEARIEREVAVAESWASQVVLKSPDRETLDHLRKWDKVLLHPKWGVLAFLVIMATLFSSIFWVAAPIMDLVDNGFGSLAEWIVRWLGESVYSDFLANGVVAGVGAVLVFVPQIFILFFGLTLLEDSGYLARAATIMDRPLHRVGLSGRAFVPLLAGFACAVPAVMACRNIRSTRERWIAVFVLPFMTCSARLPVYVLLLSFLFHGESAWMAGFAMTALYLGGGLLGVIAAAVLNQLMPKSQESHFLMELPVYRWPKFKFTLSLAFRRTQSYVKKAGPTIFFFALAIWTASHFPVREGVTPTQQLEQSVIGQFGQMLEPVFEPMGIDWRVGVGVLSAFVAREVFVSTLAVIFSVAGDNEDAAQASLIESMRNVTFDNGAPIFTMPTVVGLMIYFMIALQCLSTTSIVWREMGSWRYAVAQLVVFNMLAYGAAVAVHSIF